MVLPKQIGEFGRKVKCSKCDHIWHQYLNSPMKTESTHNTHSIANSRLGNGVNLPALLPIKIPQYLYCLPILLISLIIFLSVILFQDKFGIQSFLILGEPCVTDIHVENNKDQAKIILSYKIVNFSDNQIKMPLIRIRLFDSNNKMLKSHIVDQTKISLSPKQYINIKTEFPSAPKHAKKIDITLGNRLDFMLR